MNVNKKKIIGIAFIVIITTLSYLPVFNADFIEFDDPDYITQNDWVKAGITSEGIHWAFTQFYAANWHPLTWVSHMLDCEFYGMHPTGHHLSSLIFHIANSILLYLLFFYATNAPYKSLAMGLFFAIHPLHVESVAWISERKDVLSTFFGLLCILQYYHYIQNFEKKYYYLMILFLCLSLMSKAMFVTMPLLLIILDIWPFKRTDTRRFKDKFPLFIPIIPTCLNTLIAQLEGDAIYSLSDVSLSNRLLNAFISHVQYIYKTIWPNHLSFLYPYPEQVNVWPAILCLFFILVMMITAYSFFSKMPFLLTGYMWFIVSLLPVIGIIQIGPQSMADRYTYVPHMGLFWAITWTLDSVMSKRPHRQLLFGIFCIAFIGFACKTYHQAQFWQNGKILFQQAVLNTKNNDIAHSNLGACLTNPTEAMEQFNLSLEINPKNMAARINKGSCLLSMEKTRDASRVFHSILKDSPNHPQANIALADMYYQQHQYKKALLYYKHALEHAQNCSSIYLKMAHVFQDSGKLIESQFFYRKALKLNPLSSVIHCEYGCLLKSLQDFRDAAFHVKRAIELNPDNEKAHHCLNELKTHSHKSGLN